MIRKLGAPWPLLGILFLTAMLFARTRGFELLVWDDSTHLTLNPLLSLPISWSKVALLWLEPYFDLYIPVTYSTWAALLAWQDRVDPAALHLLNVGFHLLNTALVFTLVAKILRSRKGAALGALVFALHPLQVETVAWISCLRDLLGAFFALAALNFAYRALDKTSQISFARWSAAATFAYVTAILAKPSAITALGVLLLLALWRGKDAVRRLAPVALLWSIPAVAITVLQSQLQPTIYIPTELSFWLRPFVALDSLAFYLGKLFWPLPLLPDYGRSPREIFSSGMGYLTWIAPVALGAASAVPHVRKRLGSEVALGLAVFAIAMSATLGFVSFGFQEFSSVADRYAYLSLLGISILVGVLARLQKPWVLFPLWALLCFWGLRSFQQLPVWQSTRTLFTHTLEHRPQSVLAHSSLGTLAAEEGRLDEAISHLKRAVELRPSYALGYLNLGIAYLKGGKEDEALHAFFESVRLDPHHPSALNNLGTQLHKRGRITEAIEAYRRAMNEDPHYTLAAYNLGAALEDAAKFKEAREAYQEALRRDPGFEKARERLALLDRLGK